MKHFWNMVLILKNHKISWPNLHSECVGSEVGSIRSHLGFTANKSCQLNCSSTLDIFVAQVDQGDTMKQDIWMSARYLTQLLVGVLLFTCVYLNIPSSQLSANSVMAGNISVYSLLHIHYLVYYRLSTDIYWMNNFFLLVFKGGNCRVLDSMVSSIQFYVSKEFSLRDWCQFEESSVAVSYQVLFSI